MSLISKIQSLISSANAVTGESRTDLTSAVQDLKDGYGGSTVEKGLVFSEYDSDGYPHKANVVGFTNVPAWYGWRIFDSNNIGKYMEELTFDEGTVTLGHGAFNNNDALKSVILPASLTNANFSYCSNMVSVICLGTLSTCSNAFSGCTAVTLYDFSHHTAVPTLSTASSFGHASGCVVKIPSALYTEWTTHPIWSYVDVTWQAV